MAKSFYQKFLSFKTRHNLSDEDVIELITEYANSSLEFARTYFTNKYNITTYVFYKARDYAIICCLVDRVLYKKIREKTLANYRRNNDKNSGILSISHFDELLIHQKQFLNEFSENEILDIGRKYAEGITVKKISALYQTGEFAIKKLLQKGIVNLIYDANLVTEIQGIVGTSLDPILNKRNSNKIALLNCYQHQILSLEFQIFYYDMYYRYENNKPSLEILKAELKNARNKYKEALKL